MKEQTKLLLVFVVGIALVLWFSISCSSPVVLTTKSEVVSSQTVNNSTSVVKPLKQIFGVNGQINFNRVGYDDSSFMRAGDSMHLDAIRIPGGTISQSYNYLKDTPSLPSVAAYKNYTHVPKIFFVLNMTTSTLNEQLNFLLLAHSLNLFTDTLYAELNNEYVSAHDDAFLDKCVTWSNFLKSQLPFTHVFFGIPGGAPKKWNQKVLDRLPDAYLVDHYHNPTDYTKNGITDTAAIDAMMRADKRQYFSGIPASKIWVTEFNLQTDKNVTPIFANDEQKKISVRYMYGWFANRGFAVVLFHNICMANGNGAITTDARGSYLSPTGIAIKDFIQSR